ncbi:MAG: TonB family protein [Candidatus Acidiferrales bacterium]
MADVWKKWEGQTVNGEFRLAAYLGGSERGAVFQAYYSDGEPRKAAIRLVFQNARNAENLLAWWEFASTLIYPNLIRILQTGRCRIGDDDLIYVVMEYADEDLSHVVPYRALTEAEAISALTPTLAALAYLQAKSVVHGRIKPANIMAIDDQLKLSTDGLRRAGEAISNPGDYDPPEAVSSPAGDVWSLGITLVEILTQRVPTWDRNSQKDPIVPESLPPLLLDIARHCLRRDPALRWTITEIGNRLNRPVAAPTTAAAPRRESADTANRLNRTAAAQRAVQPVLRNVAPKRSWFSIAAVILLLALTGYAGWRLLNRSTNGAAHISEVTDTVPDTAPAKAAPEPQPAESAAPSEEKTTPPEEKAAPPDEKTTPPNEKQGSGEALQAPLPSPTPPAQAPSPAAGAAAGDGVIRQVLPNASQKALNTIRGTVRVGIKVSVDPTGEVTDATIDSPGPSSYFANLALEAARQWKFAPASGAASNWILSFEFAPGGAKASAQQSSP